MPTFRKNKTMRFQAAWIAGLYMLLSAVWIAFSDRALSVLAPNFDVAISWLNTYKGWFFVLVTTVLLHQSISRALARREVIEEALCQRGDQLREVLVSSPTINFILKLDESAVAPAWMGENVERITGYSVEEVRSLGWWATNIHPDDRARAKQAFQQVLSDGESTHTYRFQHRAGHYLWLRSELRLKRDDQGQPGFVVGAWTDITRQRQSEDQLRLSAAVIENTHSGVIVVDPQGMVQHINAAFTRVSQYAERDIVGQHVSILSSKGAGSPPFDALWQKITVAGQWHGELAAVRRDGERYTAWLTVSAVHGDAGVTHYVGIFSDISKLKRSEERLNYLANHDPLTGLPNRRLILSRLSGAIEAARLTGRRVALLYLDLDGFKIINDGLGHAVGDDILRQVSHRLSERLRTGGTLARFGGDEFVALIEDLELRKDAERVARDLMSVLEKPFRLGSGGDVFIGASVGISLYPDDTEDSTLLLSNADAAMYEAKLMGRDRFLFYSREIAQRASRKLDLELKLRRALEQGHGEFRVFYQPVVDIASGKTTGAEALLRWQPPGEDMISPTEFIPVAEDTGLIVPLGAWVLRAVVQQVQSWLAAGFDPGKVAVNLSAEQLQNDEVIATVRTILAETGISPAKLELELTESSLMGRGSDAVALLEDLKSLGIGLAIDDFGTGYSSLAYLKRFPVDKLKIDRSFIQELDLRQDDQEIVQAIIAMARALNMTVQAEGVETRMQLDLLRELNCQSYQGYLCSPPLPADAFEAGFLR